MVAPFDNLADFIANEFSVPRPLLVRLDQPDGRALDRHRVEVVFDLEEDARRFRDPEMPPFNQAKQKLVVDAFAAMLADIAPLRSGMLNTLTNFRKTPLPSSAAMDKLFVIFSSFEKPARIEAVDAIHESEVEEIARQLGLWKVHRLFAGVTFMFETDAEARAALTNGAAARCRKLLAEALRPHDTFGYFADRPVHTKIDSRESFQRDFNGSWFHYTR
ncbi:hypothetical protein AAV99_07520 [Aurantiacibacter marinus]|uniref:Uncharacterized protein n=2 Tax=Aurantiacibacter marinus TaxID=874156 RepID=A0A0H0XNS6_9SPHN|nr:hypothetical protein AAV99_07520 [Aurantiacibacter marinus]